MHLRRPAVLVALLLTAAPAFAQETTIDTVVATVNGTEITVGHMAAARERLPEQYRQLPDDVLFDGLLDQLVQQEALGKDAGDLSKLSQLTLDNERRSLKAAEIIRDAVAVAITDEAIQAAYDADFADADPAREYNASHILVETEDEAKALIVELADGADFAALAQEHSTGPSGPNGGSLGWFSAGAMVPEFEAATVALEAGGVSDPVQTQFGWHVVMLNETRIKDAPALADVREEIVAGLQDAAVDEILSTASDASEVSRVEPGTIDPSFLSNPDILSE